MEFSLKNILLGLVSIILIASISFFGASILQAVEKVNNSAVEITLIKKDMTNIVKDISSIQAMMALSNNSDKIENLETEVEVLKTRVDNLEKQK